MELSNRELVILEEMSDTAIGESTGLVKLIRRLSSDLLDARAVIMNFCKEEDWAAQEWKEQPHIKLLYDMYKEMVK